VPLKVLFVVALSVDCSDVPLFDICCILQLMLYLVFCSLFSVFYVDDSKILHILLSDEVIYVCLLGRFLQTSVFYGIR
jgi:hypothetical protein